MSPAPATLDPTLAERTRRKINRRLIPFPLLLYTIAYLDRANLGYASLDMTRELHFSNQVYGLGGGIFYLGYWLLEIPGAILVERWSARKWISRIMISWGLVASLTGFIHTASEFYSTRFFLGVAEAGFFPGVVVYLTHWFRAQDRAKALAGFFVASPLSQIVGSPLSAALMRIHWFGWSGWRWLLILEGVPAIVAGVWTLLYLTDSPRDASWLTTEEKKWIAVQLEEERRALSKDREPRLSRVIIRPDVLVLTAIWFFATSASNAFALWLPKFIQGMSGYSPATTTLVSVIPYLAGLPFSILIGWTSDRTGERRWHTAGCLFLAAVGLLWSQKTSNTMIGILALTVAAMGSNAKNAPFWSVASSVLTGTASALAIAVISSFGQLGSFVAPYAVGFLTDQTGNYAAGTFYLTGCMLVGACLMLFFRPILRSETHS
jgi:ACS family tartrate transporter-like MFS transporter